MLSKHEEELERRATLENDLRVREQQKQREQSGTYLSHTFSEVGGRFAVTEHQTITGVVSPAPPPLPSSSPWSGSSPEPGIEPPLGVEINRLTPYELEPSISESVEETCAPAGAAFVTDGVLPPPSVELGDAGASFSHELGGDLVDLAGGKRRGPPAVADARSPPSQYDEKESK
jgi:hypothetical protein